MAEVPLSMDELEDIVSFVARDLLEELAIEIEMTDEEMPAWASLSAKVTVFVINAYMDYMNKALDSKALRAAEWKLTDPA